MWIYTSLRGFASPYRYSPESPSAYAVPTMLYWVTTALEVSSAIANTTLAINRFIVISPLRFRSTYSLNEHTKVVTYHSLLETL